MIAPTIGRVVWFWQNAKQVQPYAAMIAFVHNDRLVNLGYMNEVGAPAGTVRVPLVQEGEERPKPPYCTWMLTEQLEAQLREARGAS